MDNNNSFSLEDLSEYEFYGIVFKRDGNKTCIIYNDHLLSIVDNSTPLNDVKGIIDNSINIPSTFAYNEENYSSTMELISNIEESTGKKVDSITFNKEDSYEIVIDGEKTEVPIIENGLSSEGINGKQISLNDSISKDNIEDIVKYLDEQIGEDTELTYKITEDGMYKLYINGEELLEIDDTYTVKDVITKLNDKYKEESQKQQSSNQGSKYLYPKIQLNLQVANEIKEMYLKTVEELCEFYEYVNHDYITDKLKQHYDTLGDNSPQLIYTLADYMVGITTAIDYCIQLYFAKDERDYAELENLCADLWDEVEMRRIEYKSAAENGNILPLENLTGEDYLDIMGESESLFDELYSGTVEDYVAKLQLVYDRFLRTAVPKIYNAMVDGVIMKYNYGEYGDQIKAEFANQVLSDDYFLNYKDNVPADLWEKAETDYDKALLLCTYCDSDEMIGKDYTKYKMYNGFAKTEEVDNIFMDLLYSTFYEFESKTNTGFHYAADIDSFYKNAGNICYPMINTMSAIKNLCTTDYSEMDVDQIFEHGYEIFDYLTELFNDQTMGEIARINGEDSITQYLIGTPGLNWQVCYSSVGSKYATVEKERERWHCWEESIAEDENVQKAFIQYWNEKHPNEQYESYADFKNAFLNSPTSYNLIRDSNSRYYSSADGVYGYIDLPFSEDGESCVPQLGEEFSGEYKLGTNEVFELYMWQKTFADGEFVDWYAKNNGLNATKIFTNNYYRKLDHDGTELMGLDDLITPYGGNGTPYNIYTAVLDDVGDAFQPISNVFMDFASQKLNLDAMKTNLPMAAALALNVDDITDADITLVKNEYYKDNPNYWNHLTDEEKRALAKLHQVDPDQASDLVKHGFHNVAVQRIGYERADNMCEAMTGDFIEDETVRTAYRFIYGMPITATVGLGDGLFGSCKGVYNLFFADGIMDEDDYYKMRIAENLQDDKLIGTTYNVASGVGNMIIPLALSAFVPYVGSWAAATWTGASVAGNERESLMQQGVDSETALKYGICKGLIAAFLERLMGGIKGIGSGADEPLAIFSKMTGSNSKLFRFLGTTLSNQFREVGQELTENVAGYILADGLILHKFPDMDQITQESIQTAYMTFLSTPFINLAGSGFQKVGRNVPQRVKLGNGMTAVYSQAELEMFIDENGRINSEEFYKYLVMEDKIVGLNLNQNSDLSTQIHLEDGKVVSRAKNGMFKVEYNDGRVENCYLVYDENNNVVATVSQENFNESVRSGKKPIIWSGFSGDSLDALNANYTTVGGIANTNSDPSYGQWGELSNGFVLLVGDYVDSDTGAPIDNIDYFIPSSRDINDPASYGTIAKNVEITELIRSGKIKTITVTSVDPDTMEITGTVEVDVTPLARFYNDMRTSGMPVDYAMNDILANFFINKVKNTNISNNTNIKVNVDTELTPYQQVTAKAETDPILRQNMDTYEGLAKEKIMIEYAQKLADDYVADHGGNWYEAYDMKLAMLKSDLCPARDKAIIEKRVNNQMENAAKQAEFIIGTRGGAYSSYEEFYADLASGSYNNVSDAYDQARLASYKEGAEDGKINVASTYTSANNVKYLGKTTDGVLIDDALATMGVGDLVEIDTSLDSDGKPKQVRFGQQTQFVASTSQTDSTYDIIAANSSESNPALKQVTSYLGVDGNADRIVEVSMQVPEGDLSYPHYDTPRANSQFTTGGLPPQTLSDGTVISAYEGVIPGVDLNSSDVNNLNTRIRVLDKITGKVVYEGTYQYIDGKLYLKRTK